MALKLDPTPDDPDVQAVLYGPVVLAGAYGNRPNMTMPRPVKDSVRQQSGATLKFTATASGETVTLLPVARVHHQNYNVYRLTGEPPTPPPAFAAWHRFDETGGTSAADATGNDKMPGSPAAPPGPPGGRTARSR